MDGRAPAKGKRLWYPAVAAACSLMILGAGLFYYNQRNAEVI